jgi:nucleotide-binding universal stress UspA family protein
MRLLDARTQVALDNVLFATDFSPASEAAMPYAEAFARRYGAALTVAHVVSPEVYQFVPPERIEPVFEMTERQAKQDMLRTVEQLGHLKKRAILSHGDVWPSLAEILATNHVDLVVIGTHGRGGLSKLVLGSVAEEIFRRAVCPVLTVGPKCVPAAKNGAGVRFRTILYATDFSPEAGAAAPYALSLAQEHSAKLVLLNIENEFKLSPQNAERERRLRALVPPDVALWCEPEFVLETGATAERILSVANEHAADLIVIGVRQSGTMLLATRLEGTVAHKVVAGAKCPVLTVRG